MISPLVVESSRARAAELRRMARPSSTANGQRSKSRLRAIGRR
ncbi:MAG TPA: hypothetical protein VHD81_10010 [Mycobacteriales bacterium]|nr:hypothetical protein [Mycobacteriales bacterium]